MKHNIYTVLAAGALTMLTAGCYEDKGNYNYVDVEEISVTLPENVRAMEGTEPIKFAPVVTSSMAGEIKEGDPNYEFFCRVNYTHKDANGVSRKWLDINPDRKKDIEFTGTVPAAAYTIWYVVKNKSTGVEYNFKTNLQILSTTFEGWMVVSNNGSDKKVRLDMVFQNAKGEDMVRQDVFNEKCPVLTGATGLVFNPSQMSYGDRIILTSETGAYLLNATTLQFTESNNLKFSDFILSTTPGAPVCYHPVFATASYGQLSQVCVTTEGNAYGVYSNTAGAAFELPMNTDAVGNDPTFKVAPFIASGPVRGKNNAVALFYDITNKRFMGWNYSGSGDSKKLLFEPRVPEGSEQKFSWQTGMDIVDMESTMFSDGESFSVLQDAAGKRHVYGIYLGNTASAFFNQDKVYEVEAENFHSAVDYAFHSQFPYMFYCKDNKVYSYGLATNKLNNTITLPAGEKVTKIKFNLWRNYNAPAVLTRADEEFIAMQHELMVASTTGAENGGVVRFYKIDTNGQMTLHKEYKGFGQEIVDVTYRERRK